MTRIRRMSTDFFQKKSALIRHIRQIRGLSVIPVAADLAPFEARE